MNKGAVQIKEELKSYENWLETCAYAKATKESYLVSIKDFLSFIDVPLKNIQLKELKAYQYHLKSRPKLLGDGSLSPSTINCKIKALKNYSQYLYQKKEICLEIGLKLEDAAIAERAILSQAEIGKLYGLCDESPVGQLDQAILSIYYGCGLRSAEGAALKVSDIYFDQKRLYVAKGKGGTERLVPLSKRLIRILENYIYEGRRMLLKEEESEQLFIGERGSKALKKPAISKRFYRLLLKANLELKDRQISLHSLRHSIASHLLQSGMKLDDVRSFLGHASLATTQIYTHLIGDNNALS